MSMPNGQAVIPLFTARRPARSRQPAGPDKLTGHAHRRRCVSGEIGSLRTVSLCDLSGYLVRKLCGVTERQYTTGPHTHNFGGRKVR